MTIYQEFEGTTVFVVGYGVWHFNSPNAYIPDSTLKAIQATTDIETYEYIAALRTALYANYPYQNTLCQLDYGQALAAMKKVYADMSQCSNTVGIVCERAETVAKCNFK